MLNDNLSHSQVIACDMLKRFYSLQAKQGKNKYKLSNFPTQTLKNII